MQRTTRKYSRQQGRGGVGRYLFRTKQEGDQPRPFSTRRRMDNPGDEVGRRRQDSSFNQITARKNFARSSNYWMMFL